MNESTEIKKLYLSSWPYNAALILTELDKIIKNNGGKIVSTWRTTKRPDILITNRNLITAIQDARARVDRVMLRKSIDPAPFINEVKQLESINNNFVLTCHGDYLYTSFILNGCYYNYNMNDNPFFEFYYTKTPVINGNKIINTCYSLNDNKRWFKDIFYSYKCTHEQRRAAALDIFNMLMASTTSLTYNSKTQSHYKNINILED